MEALLAVATSLQRVYEDVCGGSQAAQLWSVGCVFGGD